MKSITVVILLILSVCAAVSHGYYMNKNVKYADGDFIHKQQVIFECYNHKYQPEVFPKIYDEVKDFNLIKARDYFKNTTVFDDFHSLVLSKLLLPKYAIFAPTNKYHMKQAITLFKLFYYVKEWDSFYRLISWAKFNVNPDMFIYSLSVAVLHRKDLAGIVLPAAYETTPFFYFPSTVINEAQRIKMQGFQGVKKINDRYTVYINSDYTSQFDNNKLNEDQRVAYFTEDIGWNTFYYNRLLDYPQWMNGEEFGLNKDRRGEAYIHLLHQFLVRYYLERRANGLGRIDDFALDTPIKNGYKPLLRYYNGEFFPERRNHYTFNFDKNSEHINRFRMYEARLYDAADREELKLPNGDLISTKTQEFVDYFGNMLENNADSIYREYYGNLVHYGKRFIGGSVDPIHFDNFVPSVSEQFQSLARDPANYVMMKHILKKAIHVRNRLTPYTYDELNFKGVNITDIEMEPLVTYMGTFDSDITNVVDVEVYDEKVHNPSDYLKYGQHSNYHGEDFVIYARQKRLNNKPFSFTLKINSDTTRKAVVLVYMGLKYDEHDNVYTINEKRYNMYKLDHFFVDLKSGDNKIVRNSNDFSWFIKDRTTYQEIYKNIMLAVKGEQKFPMDMSEAHCGIPRRLMLPRGGIGGKQYQFFYMVVPFVKPKVEQFSNYDPVVSCGIGSGARYLDNLPFGFPFDRHIIERNFYTRNMKFYDTQIYHKTETEVNSVVQTKYDV